TIVAGVDGYSLANVQTSAAPIQTAADSALRAAQGSAARATVRLTSVLRAGGVAGAVRRRHGGPHADRSREQQRSRRADEPVAGRRAVLHRCVAARARQP